MSTISVARRLARFTTQLFAEDIPDRVADRATVLALDTLGSCLASSTMDFGRAVIRTAERLGGTAESSIIGATRRVAMASAVLANATLAHGLDFDDTREGAIVHTGAVNVPTALAVAEAAGAPGRAALTALVAGVEVMCRIGLAVPGRFHARNFHPTALTGTFAATAVAGRLLGLDEDRLVHAFGIAGSQASGIIEYLADGSWTKRLHAGWAAHSGIVAALLAEAGFTGPETVFEGRQGFYRAFAGELDEGRLEHLLATLGHEWELEQLTFKPYPCGSIAQPYMDCAQRLRTRLAPSEIVSIVCRTSEGPVPRLWEPLAGKHRPANGYAAKFSLPYLIAVILVKGKAGLAEFTDGAAADKAVLDVAAKVGYRIDPTIDYPKHFVGHVSVELRDGRRIEESRDHPRGGPDDPLTAAEIEAKFRGNASLALPADAVERAIAAVGALRAAGSVTGLMESLA
jgi:2-methylcitrate dehydratase PrpD